MILAYIVSHHLSKHVESLGIWNSNFRWSNQYFFTFVYKMFSQMRNLSCGCEINADVFNNVVTNTQIRISVLKSNYKLKLTSGVLIKRWDWEIVKCNFSCYSPCNSNSLTYLPTVNLNRLSQMPRQAQMINTNNQD